MTVNPTLLKEMGLVKKEMNGLKVLASGKLDKKLTVQANKFSNAARLEIEKNGGKAEVI